MDLGASGLIKRGMFLLSLAISLQTNYVFMVPIGRSQTTDRLSAQHTYTGTREEMNYLETHIGIISR